jgi:hypothetical protein
MGQQKQVKYKKQVGETYAKFSYQQTLDQHTKPKDKKVEG